MNAIIATTPQGMVEAQATTIRWIDRKLADANHELVMARQTYDALIRGGQRAAPATGLIRKSRKRIEFYEKVKRALEEGFYIIPPFDVQVFALRVDRAYSPDEDCSQTKAKIEQTRDVPSLPIGEGEYVDPQPPRKVSHTETETARRADNSTYERQITLYKNEDWKDVAFPLKACKPEIIEATTRALGLKIFDALGIAPAYRAADPIIVGHIVNPLAPRWSNNRLLTFFVAWWLDERDL